MAEAGKGGSRLNAEDTMQVKWCQDPWDVLTCWMNRHRPRCPYCTGSAMCCCHLPGNPLSLPVNPPVENLSKRQWSNTKEYLTTQQAQRNGVEYTLCSACRWEDIHYNPNSQERLTWSYWEVSSMQYQGFRSSGNTPASRVYNSAGGETTNSCPMWRV